MLFHLSRSSAGIPANIFECNCSEYASTLLIHCRYRYELPLEALVQKIIVIEEQLVKASHLAASSEGCLDFK